MYDGLSKNDLRIILATQFWLSAKPNLVPMAAKDMRVPIWAANQMLEIFEALSAESESSAKRDDG